MTAHNLPLRERLLANRIVTESGCWEWTKARSDGYGCLRVRGSRTAKAHRLSYETFVGPIPIGQDIDHLCKNKACINPEHLEPVDGPENTRRALRVGHHVNAPTTCPKGHDWSVTPPYITRRANGTDHRACRVCALARRVAYDARRRSA